MYVLVGEGLVGCCCCCCCWFFCFVSVCGGGVVCCWCGGVVVVVLVVVVVWDEVACFWVYFAYGCACVCGLFVLVSVGFGDFVDVLVFACFSCDYALFW